MKALVYPELHKIELREVEKPVILNETDVIVKITLTTICGSDLHFVHGVIPTTPGYVLGHEYVGIIEEAGSSVKGFKPGDRVIGPPAPFCGQCENCYNGNYSHCLNGSAAKMHGGGALPGTHAEYIRVPFADTCLCHVPDHLTDEQVIFIPDILSTGYSAVMRGNIKPGDTVAVFGAGPVGLCAVATAKLFSPKKIILVGRRDQFRLDIGKELGATEIIRSSDKDVVAEIFRITGGKGVDVAIDASGAEVAIQQAVRCLGIKGRLSLVGISGGNISLPIAEVFYRNITINMGLGSLKYMRSLMDSIDAGLINLSPLITHRMNLSEIEKAFELFENKSENVLKIVIKP